MIANPETWNLNHNSYRRLAKYERFGMESGYSLTTLDPLPSREGKLIWGKHYKMLLSPIRYSVDLFKSTEYLNFRHFRQFELFLLTYS